MTYRCLIIPDNQVVFARTLSATVAGPSGDNMWTTGLSASGATSISHWISAGVISEDFATLLPLTEYVDGEPEEVSAGNASATADLSTAAGFSVTTEEVQALFTSSSVTAEDAFAAMARMNLVIFNEELPS